MRLTRRGEILMVVVVVPAVTLFVAVVFSALMWMLS